ncbi:hypothetical protein ES705_27212 [subsurface metagenome]
MNPRINLIFENAGFPPRKEAHPQQTTDMESLLRKEVEKIYRALIFLFKVDRR